VRVGANGAVAVQTLRYWDLDAVARAGLAAPFAGDAVEARDELARRLERSVGLRMVADVPVGAFLSGGVDSSAVVAMMAGASRDPVKTCSIGFDVGGNAAKCFTLVYNLRDPERLFQRFPGVEGSLYFVGGFSLNYNRTDDITLAPVRFGVGWRQGASIGYLHFTRKFSPIPI